MGLFHPFGTRDRAAPFQIVATPGEKVISRVDVRLVARDSDGGRNKAEGGEVDSAFGAKGAFARIRGEGRECLWGSSGRGEEGGIGCYVDSGRRGKLFMGRCESDHQI